MAYLLLLLEGKIKSGIQAIDITPFLYLTSYLFLVGKKKKILYFLDAERAECLLIHDQRR